METIDRPMLMRKTVPALKALIRSLGADSQPGESKESLIHRILMFAPQKFKEEVKVEKKTLKPVVPEELTSRLLPLINEGLHVSFESNTWLLSYDNRQDSGNLAMPINAIERCAKYLMRIAV